ncbi:xanthine dehydrogenase small subunit [Halomonas sp. Bachu 37]|uniref:xanthine dehydrogenase small subunit n=1 Tax=Halomonas kashgarensis TaxID=3084920 RepID=UPI0032162BD7
MATIDFLLNGEARQCDVSPDTSVLELLRDQLGYTGTKEGCASGDCGACTVAIGSTSPEGKVHYHSANGCITPAHQLQGRSLVSVEGLAQGQRLHPAQAAMVDCHGSQCGFCTPGIVMSLFTLHESHSRQPAPLTPERLEAALGGNLCRCTGYRPIRDAALSMAEYATERPAWLDVAPKDAASAGLASPATNTSSAFFQPRSLDELVQLRRDRPQARLVAGATDLWLESTQRLTILDQLIDVSRVEELLGIEETTHEDRPGWWIGAAVTYSRLQPLFEEHLPAFAHLLHRLGSAQVRNRGTLGGNIANASPIGDCPPVLLALGAKLQLASSQGTRIIELEEFFLDYKRTALGEDEVIASIFVPRLAANETLKVWKLSKRREDDISAVLGAFRYRHEDGALHAVRVAFGGMAAIPKRAMATERCLDGQPVSADVFSAAKRAMSEDFQPMSDVRGSAEYRNLAAANLLERLYLTLSTPDQEVMLHAYAH